MVTALTSALNLIQTHTTNDYNRFTSAETVNIQTARCKPKRHNSFINSIIPKTITLTQK